MTTEDPKPRLRVFRTDAGITISFGEKTYFIDKAEPFYNIGIKSLKQGDYIPFYVEVARREGKERNLQKALSAKYKKPLQKISWIELTVNHSNLKSLGCALAKVESGSVGMYLAPGPKILE